MCGSCALHVCYCVERQVRAREADEVGGVRLLYKCDGKLFRRYSGNVCVRELTEFQFANDSGLLSSTTRGAESRIRSYQEVGSRFYLTIGSSKTKHMVTATESQLKLIVVRLSV